MGVQASGTQPQLQEKGAVLAETLIDKDLWETLCHRTKAKQVMDCFLQFHFFGHITMHSWEKAAAVILYIGSHFVYLVADAS